jgi:hypothetical protein
MFPQKYEQKVRSLKIEIEPGDSNFLRPFRLTVKSKIDIQKERSQVEFWSWLANVVRVAFLVQVLGTVLFCRSPRRPGRKALVMPGKPISVSAFFMTDNGSTRVPQLLDYIHNEKIDPDLQFEYWLVNYTTYNDTKKRSLYPPDNYRVMMTQNSRVKKMRKHLDLSAKFFFSLKFFLENSTASWFYRATDDTIINFRNFGPYMRYIEDSYNPWNQSVIIAHCIDSRRFSYLQGGSGFLISRHMAQQLGALEQTFFRDLKLPEDVFFSNRVFDHLNLSYESSTSPYFIGHDIYDGHQLAILKGRLDALPPCPDIKGLWVRKCRRFISPLQDVVFWHREGGAGNLTQTLEYFHNAMSQPRYVMWWMNRARPYLCRASIIHPRPF